MPENESRFSAIPEKALIAILFFAAAIIYVPTLSFERLAWDDFLYIGNGEVEKTPGIKEIKDAFKLENEKNQFGYKPLQILSYTFDDFIWGGKTYGYRITNILLHALCTVLAFFIIKAITENRLAAFLTALLFAVFPAHTEAVCWVSERKGLLACFFIFIAYLHDIKSLKSGRLKYSFISIFAVLCSLLSKGMWVTYPALILVTGIYLSLKHSDVKSNFKRWLKLIFPVYVIIAVIFSFIQIKLGNANTVVPLGENIFERALFVNLTYWNYLKMFISPDNINPVNLWAWDGLPALWITYGTLLMSAGMIIPAIAYWRREPEMLFVILLFVISLLPVSNVVPMLYPHGDRFLYGPSLAILTVPGILFSHTTSKSIWKIIAVLVIILYSSSTIMFSQYWQSDIALFSYAAEKDPVNQTANYNIATILERYEGQEAEAIDYYERAIFEYHKNYYHQTLAENAAKRLLNLYKKYGKTEEINKFKEKLDKMKLKCNIESL